MASINPFPDDSASGAVGSGAPAEIPGASRWRGALKKPVIARPKTRRRQRLDRQKAEMEEEVSGFPEFEDLKPVLGFLCVPAFLVLVLTATGGGWPSAILYPIALCLGGYVALSALRGVELVLACMLIYLPFSKIFVVPIAPGVNGTNMLVLLGLFAALLQMGETKRKWNSFPPGTFLVAALAVLSSLSAFTITLIPGGRVFLVYNELLSYKAWVDQFIFYFIALMCIRDVDTAKRCFIYLMLGSMLVVLFAVPEMLQKAGRSTIDKSRIGGPHLQSNNFGGFVAYTVLPLVAVFVIYIKDLRAWLLTPYFLLTAKVLITTFSRGAYLAILVGGLLAGWYKGRGFLMMWLSILLCVMLAFPVLIPEAIVTRMQTLSAEDTGSTPTEERLDRSSSVRLIMWSAAWEMMKEDPIWGKGFKGFQLLKADYTEEEVEESDPHSMYLYIGSQMGIPSMILFVLILCYSFYLGRALSRSHDKFVKAIGIGGAASTACFAVVCVFGSRAVSLNFTVYFWTLLVAMQVIKQQFDAELALKRAKPKRTFAHDVQPVTQDRAEPDGELQKMMPYRDNSGSDSHTGANEKPSLRGAAAYQGRRNGRSRQDKKTSAKRSRSGKRIRNLPKPFRK